MDRSCAALEKVKMFALLVCRMLVVLCLCFIVICVFMRSGAFSLEVQFRFGSDWTGDISMSSSAEPNQKELRILHKPVSIL